MFKSFFPLILTTIALFSCSCTEKAKNPAKTLSFFIAETIPVPEPSGIDFNYSETGFWVVSDQNSKVYLIDSWGREVKSFTVEGEDLEGVTVVDENSIAVVLERSREIVILDTSGVEQKRVKLNLEGELNMGLEGITYDPAKKIFYVLNEMKPRLLITLDENLNEIRRDSLDFSMDVSGIFFDDTDNTLWILSDESQSISHTDLRGNQLEEFKVSITQPEGITFNKARTKIYIVSDRTENLYILNFE